VPVLCSRAFYCRRMGLFERKRKKIDDDEPMDPEARSPATGLKYKDLQLLGAIKDNGCNLAAARHVLHFNYMPSEQAAEAAADACRSQGWEASVREPLPDCAGQWAVIAEKQRAVLSLAFVRDATDDFFEALAANHEGEHDGWEAGPDLPAA